MFYQPNNQHNNSLLHPTDEMYFHPEPFHQNSRDTPRELSFIVLKENQGKVDFAKKCSNDQQSDNEIQIHEQAQEQCDPLPTCDSFIMETPKKTAQRNNNFNHDNTSKDYEQRNMDALLVSCVKRKGQYHNNYRNSDYSQQETSSQKLSQSSSSRLSHQGIREVAEFRLEELKKDGIMQENNNDRGLNQMFGMVAREIQNSFWQMNDDSGLQQQKRSKSSASLMSSSTGGSEYNVWENSDLEMRGIDTSNWIDLKPDQPTPFTLFHLYKARAGQIDGVPISNQQVLRIMDRFVQNKKAQNIHQYPWFCFDDRLGYAHLQTDIAKEPLCMQFIEKYQEEQKLLEQKKQIKKQHKQEIISQQSCNSAGTIAPSSSGFVIDPKLNRKQVLSATRITPVDPTHFQQSARKDKNNLPCFKSSSLQRLHTNQTNQSEPFDFDDLLAVTYASDEKHILTGRHFKQDFNNLKVNNPKEQKENTKQLSLSPPIKVIDENAPRNHSTVRLKAKIIGNVQCKGYNSIIKNQTYQQQLPQQIISPERNLKKMTTQSMDKTPVLKRKNPKQISDMTSTLQKAKSKAQNPSLIRQPSLEMKNNNQSSNVFHGNDKTSKKGSSIDKSTSILKPKSKSKSKEPKKFTSPNKCLSVGIDKKKTKQEEQKINFNNSTTNQTLAVKQVKTTNNAITPNNPSHQQQHKHPCIVQSSSTVSGQTCRKDFLKYFSADYEAELKKRRFVSSSCDRVPKLHHVIQASPDSNRKKISTPLRQIQSTVVKKNCPGSVQRLNQFSSCPNNLKTTVGRDALQTIRSKGPLKSSRCLFQWQEPQIVTSEFTVGEQKKEEIYRQDQQENHECNETFDPALIANNIDFSQFYNEQSMAGKVNKLGQINHKDNQNLNKILDPKEIERKEAIQREQEKNKLSEVLKQLNESQCDFQRMCQLKGITESISSARQFRQQEFGLKNEFVGVASKINENSRQAEEKLFKNRLGFFKALKNKQISQKPYLIV